MGVNCSERRRPVGRLRLEMEAIYMAKAGNGKYYTRGLAGYGPELLGIG